MFKLVEGQRRGITQAGTCAIEMSTRRRYLSSVDVTLGKCCVHIPGPLGQPRHLGGIRTASDMQSGCRPCDLLRDRALIESVVRPFYLSRSLELNGAWN